MPLAVYVYFRYGRPDAKHGSPSKTDTHSPQDEAAPKAGEGEKSGGDQISHHHGGHMEHSQHHVDGDVESQGHANMAPQHHHMAGMDMPSKPQNQHQTGASHAGHDMHRMNSMNMVHAMHGPSPDRPMWATVAIGVSHCGGGCVLGDLVGEWLVYGTGAMINGHDVWPCLLIDYAFALLFGIAFQYLSIAPMTGNWGLKTIWRAAKADILSLTCFEIGLFGWMVIYQVAIWDYQLEMNTWAYWWMMQVSQVGQFCG